MATGTSSVTGAEAQSREAPAHPEGALTEGQLPPLPSPSFPLCKKPIGVWSEEYVWGLLTEGPQSWDCFGEGLEARSAGMSRTEASSAKQSIKHLHQTRPTGSSSSKEPPDTRTVCTTKNTASPSQSSPTLVPDTPALSRPPHGTIRTGISATSSGHPRSSVFNSSQNPPSPPVIDLTAVEDDNGGYDDQDFDELFASVDMAQFDESSTLSQSHDHGMTTIVKQDSKVQPLSSRRGQNSSMPSKRADSRAEVYSDSGGGRVGSGRAALQTGLPSRSQKGKASFSHRLEVEKSSVSSCPVCAVAFQPRYVRCTYAYSTLHGIVKVSSCKNGVYEKRLITGCVQYQPACYTI